MQGSQQLGTHMGLKCESVWFKTKLASQFLAFSFLLCNPFFLPYLHAAPLGGNVVGGTGSISQSSLTTTINQASQNLAVNWQSFDVKANEKVNFVQPNSSSIALNRILGNNGSTIQGQINANGQVILVNPNGVFFTPTATVNVGGLVASSLDMSPADFMNGNYIFNEVIGSDGAVINSGIINASLGGNVALLGKKVKNEGLISAKLGSVALAAGKQSVLTFDNQGLIGVKVTKEVLQNEVGLDAAVINSGKINAAGGRVLLTASTSKDVFSQAVKSNVDQATSVVVNPDGSFTLGGGADVLNTGSIDVSSATNNQNTARIVLLGENVTSSGNINADVMNGNAGEIEIHAKDKTLLTGQSMTSAQALTSGSGGQIKVLGDKVGLFDQSTINASGANGGGEVLFGGDRQGQNPFIRDSNFIYLGADTRINADATGTGNGGKIITFAKDTARIHGALFARGGNISGDGGFIETSGLHGFEITRSPDVSAINGNGGLWLIDPYNIEIVNTGVVASTNYILSPGNPDVFTSNGDSAKIEIGLIANSLLSGDVNIVTGSPGPTDPPTTQLGDITFNADLTYDMTGTSRNYQLKLIADNDITFTSTSSITRLATSDDSLDLVLQAGGNISLSADTTSTTTPVAFNGINLYGGKLDLTSGGVVTFGSGTINTGGGNIDVINSSGVDFNGSTITTTGGNFVISQTGNVTSPLLSSISTGGGDFTVNNATNFDSSNININVASGSIDLDGAGTGVTGNVILGNLTANGGFSSDLTVTQATSILQATNTTIFIARNTDLDVTSGAGTHSIALNESTNNFNNIKFKGSTVSFVDANSVVISGGSSVSSLLKVNAAGNITDGGSFTVSNGSNAIAIFDTTIAGTPNTYGDITLNNNNNFDNIKIINANNTVLKDITSGIAIEANSAANTGGIHGNLTVTSTGNGNITDMNGVTIPNSVPASTYTGEINVGGNSLFKVKSSNDISLTAANNTFTGSVDFSRSNTSGKINNISIVDDTALQLRMIDITGNLNTTAAGITQNASNIIVAGITTLSSSADITLTNSNNDFNNVTVINGQAVSITDTNALNLLSSTTSGNLTLQAGGDISLVGDIATNKNTAANAGNVNFIGNVLLAPTASTFPGNTININTNASGVLTDGTVTFTGTLDNDQTTTTVRNNLNIISGDGNIDFQGNIGSTANIASLIINKGLTSTSTVNLQRVRTRALDSAATSDAIDITAGTINLAGNLETNRGGSLARGVNLNGNVILGADVTINTDNSSTDGKVTISGTVNSDTSSRKLTIKSDSGNVDLQQAVGGSSALSALEINSGIGNSTVNLASVSTDGGNNVIRVDGTTINLNSDINSNINGAGGDIRFDGNVVLNNSVSMNSLGTGGNGNIDVNGNINGSDALNTSTLTINSGSNTVTLKDVGNTQAIQKLSIVNTSGDINVGAINTRDNLATVTDTGVVLTTSGKINLAGNITTNVIGINGNEAGLVDIDGDVNLLNNITVSTNALTSAGTVAFAGTVDADLASNNRNLTVNAGTSTVTFSKNVGSSQALNSLLVNSAGTTTLQTVKTNAGGVNITSGTIDLFGDINTKQVSDAGAITLNGAVNLKTTNTGVTFDTHGTNSDANIFINGSVNNATSKALTLIAGQADVTMTGIAGSGTALSSLTVSSANNVSLGDVTSLNAMDVTGNTKGTGNIYLFGNLTTTATATGSDILLKQADVILKNNVSLNVASSNNITIGGTVNADSNTSNRTLSVNAGSGTVTFLKDIGMNASGALQGLSVTTAVSGTTKLKNVKTRSGGLTVNTAALELGGNLLTNDDTTAGNISLTAENITLTKNTTFNTNSSLNDGSVNVILPVGGLALDGGNNSLILIAGSGDVTVKPNVTNVSVFDLQSSGTSELNGISVSATGGTINAVANNGLTLNGNYSAVTGSNQVMSFDADNDNNAAGVLTIGNGAAFTNTNGPISFKGASLSATNSFSIDAGTGGSKAVQFYATNDLSFGTTSLGFALNNTQLGNITASSIELNAAKNIYFSNVTQTSGPGYVLTAGNNIINSGTTSSSFSSLNATAANGISLNNDIISDQNLALTGSTINIINDTSLSSNTGNVLLSGQVTGVNRNLHVTAFNGTAQLLTGSNVSNLGGLYIDANNINLGNSSISTNNIVDFNVRSSGGTFTQNSNIQSLSGSVAINLNNNNYVMGAASSLSAGNNINILSQSGNIGLASVSSISGTIDIKTNDGSIYDNNDTATPNINITSNHNVLLAATKGIGSGNPLEFSMNGASALLTATNTGTGNIEITNTGNITLQNISNAANDGAFILKNNGDVLINSVVLNKLNATEAATFNITNGSIYAKAGNAKHVTANSAFFYMNNAGGIGQDGTALITDVPYRIEVLGSLGTYIKYYGNVPPDTFLGDNDYKNRALQVIDNLSGQQLIQVETLAEIDPAIFTDVRNYNNSDVALMMPEDQRYNDAEDDDDDAKQKRNKFLNSKKYN